jgi:hypothetical protein
MNVMFQSLMQAKTYKQIYGGFNMCVLKKEVIIGCGNNPSLNTLQTIPCLTDVMQNFNIQCPLMIHLG